jgi:hypothetical protein
VGGRFVIAHLEVEAGQVVHRGRERNELPEVLRDLPGLDEVLQRVTIIEAREGRATGVVPVHGGSTKVAGALGKRCRGKKLLARFKIFAGGVVQTAKIVHSANFFAEWKIRRQTV